MNLRKILFVDDDPHILAAIRRSLYSMRKEFDLQFVSSGEEALEVLKDHSFEVIVSDLQLLGMSGVHLFTEIKKIHPYSIRLMLSGSILEELIMNSVGLVHQFMAKPCDPQDLKSILLQSCALHDVINNRNLKQIISGIDTLPSLPKVYEKLRKTMRDPDVPLSKVAEIIEEDMAMSSKVLQLVNSAFFGLFQKVDSPARGVKLLGLETINALVLCVGAFTEITTTSKVIPAEKLCDHSVAVANYAKRIALSQSNDTKLINDCFIAGLLHDIGKLVFLTKMTDKYEQVFKMAHEQTIPLRLAEKEIITSPHCAVGAYLMGLWGMSGQVIEAIAFHHHLESYPAQEFNPAVAVHVANALYYENHPDEAVGTPQEVNVEYLQALGLEDNLNHWRGICCDEIATVN